ncbi:hypothetical protein C8R48DRAFT_778593 [Suillus tomentosus]|nr:hypothetical protein C8R48DRAFT_778593 [Suillus tomentosus]
MESSNSGPPAGAGGKNMDVFNPTGESGQMTENEVARLARFISQTSTSLNVNLDDHEAVVEENLWHFERNSAKARLQEDPNYIEVLSDDEDLLEEPMSEPSTPFAQTAIGWKMTKAVAFLKTLTPTMRKIVERITGEDTEKSMQEPSSSSSAEVKIFTSANTILAQGTEGLFEIPRPLLNLAKAKMHEDPSCVKLKKGLVLNDPKMIVMDTTSGFPPELTLTADIFFEVSSNFLKLLALVADDDMVLCFTNHRTFWMSRDEFTSNFSAVLRFDIETCRRFFNTSVFLDTNAYKEHWSEVKIDLRMNYQTALLEWALPMMASPTTSFASFVGVHSTNLQHHPVCYPQLILYEAQLSRAMCHARTLPAPHDVYAHARVPALERPIVPAIQKHPSTVHQVL